MSEDKQSPEKPNQTTHSDNRDSALPHRDDGNRKMAPNDLRDKKTDEPPVG
ncbi:hypothetical protein ACQUFY_09340 [Robbsia andropogonis]|uniref:hypothetical protein n=1 Tax=Robbsia andropogonis TaxID=28092 RepID=UPI003D1C6FDD